MPVIEIEVANDANADLFYLPLGKRLRGKVDFLKVNEAEAIKLAREYPQGIPGQRLVIDTEAATAAVVEPLHEPQHAAVREKVAAKGFGLPPAREEAAGVDVPTCLFWARRAVEGGLAKVVRGSIPKVEGRARKRFMTTPDADPAEDDRELRRQELAAKLAMMNPTQRAEFKRLLAEAE
jgi:hypothetical protein